MTLDIKLSNDTAAVIIQKEVRKFLANLGFYHAKARTPQRDPSQINLFIERSSNKNSKSASKSRHGRSFSGLSGNRKYSPDFEMIDPESGFK